MAVEATDMQLIDEEIISKSHRSGTFYIGSVSPSLKNKRIQRVSARYLGPRVGSCHDHCKHHQVLPFDGKFSFLISRRISRIQNGYIAPGKDADLLSGDNKLMVGVVATPINGSKLHSPSENDSASPDLEGIEVSLDSAAKGFESSRGKVVTRKPRLQSTRISNANEGKGKLSASALASSRTLQLKKKRVPLHSKGKLRVPVHPPVVPARSVDKVPSMAMVNSKNAKKTLHKKCDHPTGERDFPDPDGANTFKNAEGNNKEHAIDDTSRSSGSIAATLPPSPGEKKPRNSISFSGSSSSRPSTTSSGRSTKNTASSYGVTSRKDNLAPGSRKLPPIRPRRANALRSEDGPRSSHKLQFRRGRVVDLNTDNSSPRKLKFRRERILGETQYGASGTARKSFKRTEADLGVVKVSNSKSERVVLRHRRQENKNNKQKLFNNVIEETAGKLVELRKSKVKALVGAFETVISLQDAKPKKSIKA